MMGCKMPWWAGSETPPPDKDKTIADLRAENAAQALLIASLKEELRKSEMQNGDHEAARVGKTETDNL